MNIFERQKLNFEGYELVAGVDEAGRGPLAGPLVVSVVILKPESFHEVLNDSKKLSVNKRELLYEWIINNSIDYFVKIVPVEEIDRVNILRATLQGMKACIENLSLKPDIILVDGNQTPADIKIPCKAIVKGDALYASIAAASILAKVYRDQIMLEIDKKYPLYEFKQHKGYPTAKHIELINKYGMCPEHRKTFTVKRKMK